MKIESVKLVYFSPTGTTRAVAHAIARGLAPKTVTAVDVTRPDVRARPIAVADADLLVVAVPVYMGRVPALLGGCLDAIQADGVPVVCVVVYGNRVYDNALLELRDILAARGAIPVAGAAYVGEHSFSTPALPVAHGRPDADDLDHARDFGRRVRDKLDPVPSASGLAGVVLPGTRPYGGITTLWNVDFIAVGESCRRCGACVEACPVGAIDPDDVATVDPVACITCCACVKACPQGARTRKPGPVMDAANRLHTLYATPRRPECFL